MEELPSFFLYLQRNWLNERWYPTISGTLRRLLPRYFVSTTNAVEGLWSVIKQHLLAGLRMTNFATVLKYRHLLHRPTGPHH